MLDTNIQTSQARQAPQQHPPRQHAIPQQHPRAIPQQHTRAIPQQHPHAHPLAIRMPPPHCPHVRPYVAAPPPPPPPQQQQQQHAYPALPPPPPSAHHFAMPSTHGITRRVIVVWDIENMPALKEQVMQSSVFAIKFREFLSQSLGVAPHSFMIFACCHLKRGGQPSVSERVIGGLTANGIIVTVMPKAKEGQADGAIKSHIHTFFEMFNTPAEDRVMILISSDSDFQHDITGASLKGCKVAVVYRPAGMGRDHMRLCSGLGDKVRLWNWLDVLSVIVERRVTDADLDEHPHVGPSVGPSVVPCCGPRVPPVARILDVDSIWLGDDSDSSQEGSHSQSLVSQPMVPGGGGLKKMVPCQFFAKYGACAKGANCAFMHTGAGAGAGAGI